ncbi:MAG: DUF4388 domain-containing protein [Blastocatellia bacterium]|nr:DUF4388 domain-containing protein [Blastocatellia bacterium]
MSSRPDADGVILDAELLIKYRMFDRALATLEGALAELPRSIPLREKLCELCLDQGYRDKAIEQLLALSTLYLEGGKLDKANHALLQAKRLNPQLSITARLNAIKEAENPRPRMPATPAGIMMPGYAAPIMMPPGMYGRPASVKVISGDLSSVSLFDIVQVIENSRISGILGIHSPQISGRIYFNSGQIADADTGNLRGIEAFRKFVDINEGMFEVEKSPVEFKQNINALSNTNLILDVLRELDEERSGMTGGEQMEGTVH